MRVVIVAMMVLVVVRIVIARIVAVRAAGRIAAISLAVVSMQMLGRAMHHGNMIGMAVLVRMVVQRCRFVTRMFGANHCRV